MFPEHIVLERQLKISLFWEFYLPSEYLTSQGNWWFQKTSLRRHCKWRFSFSATVSFPIILFWVSKRKQVKCLLGCLYRLFFIRLFVIWMHERHRKSVISSIFFIFFGRNSKTIFCWFRSVMEICLTRSRFICIITLFWVKC